VEIGIEIKKPRREPNATGRMEMVMALIAQMHIPLLLLMAVSKALVAAEAEIGIEIEVPRREPNGIGRMDTLSENSARFVPNAKRHECF